MRAFDPERIPRKQRRGFKDFVLLLIAPRRGSAGETEKNNQIIKKKKKNDRPQLPTI